MSEIPIRRALISVYDKTGIVDFARALHGEFGIEIISTGGTARLLRENDIPVTLVEDITGFPEMLDGRVKTLHPKIHAAILADRDNPEHMRQLAEQNIQPIDMVVVNLYPFEETVRKPDCTFDEAIEMIDIGGPCLLRAAAKNHGSVIAISDPEAYDACLEHLRCGSCVDLRQRMYWTREAFDLTSEYDEELFDFFCEHVGVDDEDCNSFRRKGETLPGAADWDAVLEQELRHGENPHQQGGLYEPMYDEWDGGILYPSLVRANVLQGEMSFNNYTDASAAVELCEELSLALADKEPRASAQADHGTRFNLSKPQAGLPTWLLTWTTHGSWHPGDERGIVRRISAADSSHPIHNRPGTPYDAGDRQIEEAARERMAGYPLHLNVDQARVMLRQFSDSATRHGIGLLAMSVMPDHVHVLCQADQKGPRLLQLFKAASSRRLSQEFGLVDVPGWWTKWGWIRFITPKPDLGPGIRYVIRQPRALCWAGIDPESGSEDGGDQESARAEARGSLGTAQRNCVFVKHGNPCGVGFSPDALEAYRLSYLGDSQAAMGGVFAINCNVDVSLASAIMQSLDQWGKSAGAEAFFMEVWVAPSFDREAIEAIRKAKAWGKRVRLLALGSLLAPHRDNELDFRRIRGGMLIQTRDDVGLDEQQWKVVSDRQPSEAEMSDLRLAWLVCKHTKSNAISICRDGMLIGNGAGQASRVMSCRIATWLANENGHAEKLKGAVAASDAFFPFRDGPDLLIDAGVTAIIQPGGSKRDEETIAACNERDVAMIFTGTRHFRH